MDQNGSNVTSVSFFRSGLACPNFAPAIWSWPALSGTPFFIKKKNFKKKSEKMSSKVPQRVKNVSETSQNASKWIKMN
jgi:hypothetical protein